MSEFRNYKKYPSQARNCILNYNEAVVVTSKVKIHMFRLCAIYNKYNKYIEICMNDSFDLKLSLVLTSDLFGLGFASFSIFIISI